MQQLPTAAPGKRSGLLPGVRCTQLSVREQFTHPFLAAEGRVAERAASFGISALQRLGTMRLLDVTMRPHYALQPTRPRFDCSHFDLWQVKRVSFMNQRVAAFQQTLLRPLA